MAITVEEARKKTRELLGLGDDEPLEFITEEFLAAKANAVQSGAGITPYALYGSHLSYGSRANQPTYEFTAGVNSPTQPDSLAVACGPYRWYAFQSEWRHVTLAGDYCPGSEQPAFRQKFSLTYTG